MTDFVLTEISNQILTVRIHRPERKNALTHAMYTALGDAIEQADSDAVCQPGVVPGRRLQPAVAFPDWASAGCGTINTGRRLHAKAQTGFLEFQISLSPAKARQTAPGQLFSMNAIFPLCEEDSNSKNHTFG